MAIPVISTFYHDSAAALVVDGDIVAAAQEERLTRKQPGLGFPTVPLLFSLLVLLSGIGVAPFIYTLF